MKFELGLVATTKGVYNQMQRSDTFRNFVNKSLARHIGCDWGDLEEGDKELNDLAVENGDDIIYSKYLLGDIELCIKTEWDRSATTIYFPYED